MAPKRFISQPWPGGEIWLERGRKFRGTGLAIFQDSLLARGSLFLCCQSQRSSTGSHIHQDKTGASITERGGPARNQGAFFRLQMVKGNLCQGLISLLIIRTGLQKEKRQCLSSRQKLLFHGIGYKLQLLRPLLLTLKGQEPRPRVYLLIFQVALGSTQQVPTSQGDFSKSPHGRLNAWHPTIIKG